MPDPLAPPLVDVDHRPDGSTLVRSRHELGDYPRHVIEYLRHWSEHAPDRTFLAERDRGGAWRRISYRDTRHTVESLGQALLDRGLSPERPLMILSENGVDHALLTLAAMHVGVPVAPVSAAYSLMSRDFAKLRAIHAMLEPGLAFASDLARFARAIEALGVSADRVISSGEGANAVGSLARTRPVDVERAYASLTPDSVAKILFTSGSTGEPKGVMTTQRMLCSNQQAISVLWPFLRERPPVCVDWLPWSHTFGANHNFNMLLAHGGSLYVDDGRPTPDGIERSARNLRELEPTLYFNVPRGFDMLLPLLERDDALNVAFFRNLDLIFYAAASLPNPLWERLERASEKARGKRVRMLSAWGLTETAPMATSVHFPIRRAGVIGLPAPGTDIKLVPLNGKLEIRVRGPNVTPGYWKRPDLTRRAFDDEGFFCTGDAVRFEDAGEPARGIVFDGRIAEDFKLTSGTWVHVGALRTAVLAATAPIVQDAVIAGLDRNEIGVLLFLNPLACRSLAPNVPDDALADVEPVRAHLAAGLAQHNTAHPGNSQHIARARVLREPPSIDAGEITDKGYINQRAVLSRRADEVDRLFRDDDPRTLRIDG